jgi:hypothetical protein
VVRYKQRLANLLLLGLAYITSPGIESELIEALPAVAMETIPVPRAAPAW